jgi:hypothetical protein
MIHGTKVDESILKKWGIARLPSGNHEPARPSMLNGSAITRDKCQTEYALDVGPAER